MANRQEIEETYNFMDEVIHVSFGEYADVTCALYNGDFSKTLAQAQRDKHDYILKAIHFKEGARVLDIGSGWGPMLKAVEERGGYAIGLTLSTKQVLALHYVEINAEASRKGRTMTIESAKATDQATQTTLSLLQDLFGSAQRHNFAVRLWDGSTWKLEPGNKEPPRFTLVLQHPGALRSMFLPPNELNLFEAYIYNDFDIAGTFHRLTG